MTERGLFLRRNIGRRPVRGLARATGGAPTPPTTEPIVILGEPIEILGEPLVITSP